MKRRDFLKISLALTAADCLARPRQGDGASGTTEVELLSQVPKVVGESVAPINWPPLPRFSQAVELKVIPAAEPGAGAVLEVGYDLKKAAAFVLLSAAPAKVGETPPERLRFWLWGDGTGNVLAMSYLHSPTKAWLPLTQVRLDYVGWRHLEIPAADPVYLYYPGIGDIVRLAILPSGKVPGHSTARVRFRKMEWVSPALVSLPLSTKDNALPAEIYDTWGGPGEEQIRCAAAVGVNLHQVPVGGIGPGSVEAGITADVTYAAKAVEWVKGANMLCCLSLEMPDTAPSWLRKNMRLLCRDEQGQTSNGILSPWNPHAQALWERHIVAVLRRLKKGGKLKFVDVIRLCPGDQGEVAFQWSNVWAFDPWAVSAYRAYLGRLYGGKIAALNADWGSNHASFENILPPSAWHPDRQHWVFTDFYRLGMLRQCVRMADAVRKVFSPKHWLWLLHSLPSYPMRFYSARYPVFYAENLRRLGLLDIAHIPGLNWQSREDIRYVEDMGVRTICEIDVGPTPAQLGWTFSQADKFRFDGVFIGIAEPLSENGKLTPLGNLCRDLIMQRQRRLGLPFPPPTRPAAERE